MREPSPIQKIIADSLKALIDQNAKIIKILEELAATGETRTFIDPIKSVDLTHPFKAPFKTPPETTEEYNAGLPVVVPAKRSRPAEPGKSVATWEAYSQAYANCYGTRPLRNAAASKMCCNLVDHLGAEDAPEVAAYYLTHQDFFYVKAGHPLTLLVRDAQKLHTEWKTGRKVTTATAKQTERRSHNQDTVKQYLRDNEENKEWTVDRTEFSDTQAEIPDPPCSVG